MTQAMEDIIFFFNGSVHLHGISGFIFEDKTDNCAINISIDGFLSDEFVLVLAHDEFHSNGMADNNEPRLGKIQVAKKR